MTITSTPNALYELHVWLAKAIPELKEDCPHCHQLTIPSELGFSLPCHLCGGPGWIPNVTTDGLAEHTPEEWDFAIASDDSGWNCIVFLGEEARTFVEVNGLDTLHLAMCHATKLAIEKYQEQVKDK